MNSKDHSIDHKAILKFYEEVKMYGVVYLLLGK
jgi:hypothetical protein